MTDTFRKEYQPITPEVKERITLIKDKAQELLDVLNMPSPKPSVLSNPNENGMRELALARTNLEQAVMWAVKGITI